MYLYNLLVLVSLYTTTRKRTLKTHSVDHMMM